MSVPFPEEKTQWAIMWVAFGGGIVAATHMGKLPAALPDIMAELNSGLVMGGWIASMISFTGFALGLVSGTIGDRIGQRRVLILGLLIISAGSLIGTFARSGEIMLLARFVEGIGYSAATVAGAGLVTHVTSDKDRKWSLGIWSSHVPVGFAGMLIGGALVLNISDWRTLWLVSTITTVFWAVLAFFVTSGWRRRGDNGRQGPLVDCHTTAGKPPRHQQRRDQSSIHLHHPLLRTLVIMACFCVQVINRLYELPCDDTLTALSCPLPAPSPLWQHRSAISAISRRVPPPRWLVPMSSPARIHEQPASCCG